MGHIFDTFGTLTYKNEDEVNQNFVIPLLTRYLGFSLDEIKPERYFPVFPVSFGRKVVKSKDLPINTIPDYIVCIGDENNPQFVVETKAITESLDKHEPQAISYASGVKVNLIVLTNGNGFRIFDANNPLFNAKTIEELDVKFDIVKSIISKDTLIDKNPMEIIQSVDLEQSLGISLAERYDAEYRRKLLKTSDFKEYVNNIRDKFALWQNSFGFQFESDFSIEQVSPEKLLKFKLYSPSQSEPFFSGKDETYVFSDLESKLKSQVIVLIGESGIGKTTALKYLTWVKSIECINVRTIQIPIYIQLRSYGTNSSIESLAIKSLAENGYSITIEEYRTHLKNNEFIFILDAFDEIPEQYVEDFQEEVRQFISIYSHRIIITSRKLRIPKFQKLITLAISPLESSAIEEFLQINLKDQWHELDNQIKWKHLENEAQNTLILTLIIHIFKEHRELPNSRPQIIKRIVDNIKDWENDKRNRLSNNFPWEIKEHLLSVLAFECAKEDNKIYFTSDEFLNIVQPIIEDYIIRKEITSEYLKEDIIKNLSVTGLIEVNYDEIFFRHRAFLEYFASIELAKQYQSNPEILLEFIGRISWNKILLGTSGLLQDSTDFIREIKKNNLYLAALCVVESNNIDASIIEIIKSDLFELCSSPIFERRQRGIFLLSKIDQRYPSDIIYKILDENKHVDVRQRALETIARTKTEKARITVNKLCNWDEPSQHFITGITVPGSVAKALSNFGENEHLKILEIWDLHRDYSTRDSCKTALLDVIRDGRLSDKVKKAIVSFYFRNLEKDPPYEDSRNISSLIIEINDENIVLELIEKLPILLKEKEFPLANFDGILAGCTSEKNMELLISIVKDGSLDPNLRLYCSSALAKTNGFVPLEIFTDLLHDNNPHIQKNAVRGLDKFPSNQIKQVLINSLDSENYFIQNDILDILAELGFLVEIINQYHLPKNIEYYSLKTILQKIRKYSLWELIPFLNTIFPRISDERLQIDFALTYYIFGDFEAAKKIIEGFYVDDKFSFKGYGLSDLIEIAPNFDNDYAFSIIERVWNYIDQSDEKKHYHLSLCLSSLAQIKSKDAISFLKAKAMLYAENPPILIMEEIFRSLNRIASEDEEEWYIQYVKKYAPFITDYYHRVIEGLGMIGTEKSEELIIQISKEYEDNEYILNVCYLSLEMIKSRHGKFNMVSEDDLLS